MAAGPHYETRKAIRNTLSQFLAFNKFHFLYYDICNINLHTFRISLIASLDASFYYKFHSLLTILFQELCRFSKSSTADKISSLLITFLLVSSIYRKTESSKYTITLSMSYSKRPVIAKAIRLSLIIPTIA